MALPRLDQTLLQYFGVIRSAVAARLSTADLWDRIKSFEAASAVSRPAQMFTIVSQMRSAAVVQRTAVTSFAAADPGQVLTPAMVGVEMTARDVITRALAPEYYIRYEATTVTPEGESTTWYTISHSGVLPATKGDILAMAGLDAVGQSTKYEYLVTGITGQVQITAY
jgi:hypothetical protein